MYAKQRTFVGARPVDGKHGDAALQEAVSIESDPCLFAAVHA